jgi:hypothetical protein
VKRNAYGTLVGKPEETTRKTKMCVDSFKIDLRERGWDSLDWNVLAQDRDQWRALVNTVMNLRVP